MSRAKLNPFERIRSTAFSALDTYLALALSRVFLFVRVDTDVVTAAATISPPNVVLPGWASDGLYVHTTANLNLALNFSHGGAPGGRLADWSYRACCVREVM